MSTPAHRDKNYISRVMIETIRVDGVPRRAHVWLTKDQRMLVSFPQDMTEEEAMRLVAIGHELLRPLDKATVPTLFQEPRRRRRHIDGGT